MSSFKSIRRPTMGAPVKADWGRIVAEAIYEQRPVPLVGQRISRTSYGTRIEFDKTDDREPTALSGPAPFEVRWYQYSFTDTSKGEWQIYLPRGCATVVQQGVTRSYVPMNEKGKDKDGNELFRWYRIADPKNQDADEGRHNKYVARCWSVIVHMKPWPRLKVSTEEKDKDFGADQWSENVATIGMVEVETEDGVQLRHFAVQGGTKGIAKVWESSSARMSGFDIIYELDDREPDAKPTVKLTKMVKMVGRLMVDEMDDREITGWNNVWVKYDHKGYEISMSIEHDLEGEDATSDDDKTVFKIYDLEDDIVTADYRDRIPDMQFYTLG